MEQYKIGSFTFDTYEAYQQGRADVQTIRKITSTVDTRRPEVALFLYQSIRSGKIKLYSKIGERFLLHLADVIAKDAAKNTQKMYTAQAEREKAGKEVRQAGYAETEKEAVQTDRAGTVGQAVQPQKVRETDVGRRIFGAVCLLSAIACFAWYFWSDFTNSRGNAVNDYLKSLKNQVEETEARVETLSNDAFFSAGSPELEAALYGEAQENTGFLEKTAAILPEYEAIVAENADFAGWITIEGTKVDYPVMLTKSDTEYYLKRNFNGQSDINGTLFMDARTDLITPSTNIIIYGHNMKSGAMFGGLKKYLDEKYWIEHQRILFDTIYEKGIYEIFAVCLAQVQYQNTAGFRYYDFIWANSEEEFNDFLDNIRQLSVFMSQEMPVYGDELLTLSTCNNYVEDGRLFLVARKCTDVE